MTQIEVRPWRELPLEPDPGMHYCGSVQVTPDGRAVLYENDASPCHSGGFCENTGRLRDYAADVVAQLKAEGPGEGWHRLPDGSYITALTDGDYAASIGVRGQHAPPRG